MDKQMQDALQVIEEGIEVLGDNLWLKAGYPDYPSTREAERRIMEMRRCLNRLEEAIQEVDLHLRTAHA